MKFLLFILLGKIPSLPTELKFPPLSFSIPSCQRTQLSNGMVLYLYEDTTSSLVEFLVYLNAGSKYDPEKLVGLASLVGEVMEVGGVVGLAGDKFIEKIESMGAEFWADVRRDVFILQFSFLQKDLDEGLKLLKAILTTPAFPEDKIQLKKQQKIERIKRIPENPRTLASEEFRRVVFSFHPYGRREKVETITKITKKDIIKFHRKYFHPNNIIMGVTGAFTAEKLVQKFKKYFSNWNKKEIDFPTLPVIEKTYSRNVYLLHKQIPQSSILIGHIGVERGHPDFFPIALLGSILGHRLFETVRKVHGLAYSVGGRFIFYLDGGYLRIVTHTKTNSVRKAIDLILEELKKVSSSPPKKEELEVLKQSIINGFVFRFETPLDIVREYIEVEFKRLPSDYLSTYLDKIRKVTFKDILKVAKTHLHPEETIILVVGDSTQIKSQLEGLGEVITSF
jgi:predicted Zn-dependent peptidase